MIDKIKKSLRMNLLQINNLKAIINNYLSIVATQAVERWLDNK